MTDEYYIKVNNEQTGPYTLHDLILMDLDVNTQVLSPQINEWQNASDLPELFEYFEARGFYFPTEDNLASFWWRLLAYIIDSVIVSIFITSFASEYVVSISDMEKGFTSGVTMAQLKFNLIVFVITVLYNSACEATPMRGSIGKKLCRLSVVDADGRRLSFGRALVRNMGKLLSSLALGIGYLSILWDDHKQGWHDQIAKTYVIIRNQ